MAIKATSAANSPRVGFRMPTHAELVSTYKGIIESRFTLKTVTTPPAVLKPLFAAEKDLQAHRALMMRSRFTAEGLKAAEAKLHLLEKKVDTLSAKLDKQIPRYDISNPRALGARKEVYVINGELLVRSRAVTPHALSSWQDAGPAPLF